MADDRPPLSADVSDTFVGNLKYLANLRDPDELFRYGARLLVTIAELETQADALHERIAEARRAYEALATNAETLTASAESFRAERDAIARERDFYRGQFEDLRARTAGEIALLTVAEVEALRHDKALLDEIREMLDEDEDG